MALRRATPQRHTSYWGGMRLIDSRVEIDRAIHKCSKAVRSLWALMPCSSWPRLTPKLAQGEIIAGLTVALVVIPQSVAYATIAGMPLIAGIYASFIPALIALLLANSPRLSVGPTALCSLLVGASLTGMAAPMSSQWITLALWLALLSGLIQIVLGLTRMGWLLKLVSSPVLMGFTQAAAVLIVASQLRALLGAEGNLGFGLDAPDYSWKAALFGVAALAILMLSKRYLPKAPMMLVVLIGSAVLSWAVGYADMGEEVVGALPAGLSALTVPGFPGLDTLKTLLLPALAIALVGFLETASSARIDHRLSGDRWNENQDLIAQGASKMAAAFTSALPISSSFSRSAVNIYAGARSGWAGLVTVAVVFVFLLWFTPYLFHVPQSVLAAIVIAAVSGLISPKAFVMLWKTSKTEMVTASITLWVTFITAPNIYWGIIVGVALQVACSLIPKFKPRIVELGRHPDGSVGSRARWGIPPLAPDVYAVRMDADLDFISASTLEHSVLDYVTSHPNVRHVCLFAHSINGTDATGIEAFGQMRRGLEQRKIKLHIVGLKLPVEKRLRRAAELPKGDEAPYLKIHRTEAALLTEVCGTHQQEAVNELDAPEPSANVG